MIIGIADLPVEWQTDYSDFVKAFAYDGAERPVMSIGFSAGMSEIHGIQYADRVSERVLRLDNGELLLADKEWTDCTVYTGRKSSSVHGLPLAAICSRLSGYSALFMHAAVVDYNGNGILFAGYSGVGKTTQAQLWQKYMNADIINGDKAFVRYTHEGFNAYGCPWKGSSEYCLNKKASLKGIVILRQCAENRITKLDDVQATELFMPHVFLPHWDCACLEKALDTFGKLVQQVDVWLLECRPDEAAVKLTHDRIFGDG